MKKEEINPNKLLDTEAVVSMELTYENIVKALWLIEEQHSILKEKFLKAKDKHSRAKNKRSLYESAMMKISYEMDIMSMQYCDILLVANEKWWTEELLKEPSLQKWWAQQVEEIRKFLKDKKNYDFEEYIKWNVQSIADRIKEKSENQDKEETP